MKTMVIFRPDLRVGENPRSIAETVNNNIIIFRPDLIPINFWTTNLRLQVLDFARWSRS